MTDDGEKHSALTQAGLVRAIKALTAAGVVIYGAFLINGGVYLDTNGTFAGSRGKASALSSPADDPDPTEDEDALLRKLEGMKSRKS